MKTKFILETSTLEDVLMKKYQDMKKQDSKACNVCEQTTCQCNKSDEKELAESQFDISEYGDTPEEIFQNIKNIIDRIALPNTDTEQVLNNVFTKWAGVEKFGDMIRNSDGTINDQAYREAYREASALANFGSQISDQWNIRMLSQNPEAWPRANNIYELSVKWFQLYKQLAKKYKNLQPQVAEGKIDFAKKLQKNVDKHNKAVVQTKKEIGSRVADIGPDAKEYNVKTDKEWDKQKGVTEDQGDECPVHGSYGFPNLQADESACTCDFDKLANPSWPDLEMSTDSESPDLEMDEGSFDRQHYFDANKDSKVRRNSEVDQSQHKQNWGRDPLDDITHLAFKAGEKVKGMFKKPSELNELGANNPPQGTAPAPTANTAANTAATTSTLNSQEKKQLADLLLRAGVK